MRRTARKAISILFVVLILFVSGYLVSLSLFDSPEYARRLVMYRESDTKDYLIFPERPVQNNNTVSLIESVERELPIEVSWYDPVLGKERVENLDELMQLTDTKAFIVIQDDKVIFEGYFNGSTRDSINTSFSTAKSFNSALLGIAIAEGKIGSPGDPVIQYIPEISGRGLDELTILDLLLMNSGIHYQPNSQLPFFLHPFGDDSITYYSPDLRKTAMRVEPGDVPIGEAFIYNNYHPLLEGLILERVTGMPVAEYLQEKIWKPMGAEFPASWSLDSENSGFEKMESGINARAIDFARFGLLYLHGGLWNGVQILPESWVRESTAPLNPDPRVYINNEAYARNGGYYKYHWWGQRNADGTYDFTAAGHHGQFIYVAPRKNVVVVRFGNARNAYPVIWPIIIHNLVDML